MSVEPVAPPPSYGEPPQGYEIIKHLPTVYIKRTTKNQMAGGCLFPPFAMVANTDKKKEIYEVSDENGPVLLKTELMRKVSCICGVGPYEMKVKLQVIDGPTLVEIHEKDQMIKFGTNKKYHAKSNDTKIGYFLKVPEDPVWRRDRNGNSRRVFTDVSYRCYDVDDNELFKIKGEHKMSTIASRKLPKVKMFIQVPDKVTEEFGTVGVISYKNKSYTINFPDDFAWPLRLLTIMASTTIETELYGKIQ